MDQANYDMRTPLHFAAKNGSLDAVKYLVSQGVSVNPADRWGAKPLNYAGPFHNVSAFLMSVGATMGPPQGDYLALASVYAHS